MGDSEAMPHEKTTAPILIAVGDALLHPEATHLAAATGRPLIDATSADDIIRHYSRAFAVLVDDTHLADAAALHARHGVFHVRAQEDIESADISGAGDKLEECFVLPAQAADLLKALGRLAMADGTVRAGPSQRSRAGRAGVNPAAVSTTGIVISLVGAVGGAGTSTLAAAVARTASLKHAPVVVDAHRNSGGLDLLFGIEEQPGARWGELALGEGNVDRAQLLRALPQTSDGIAVLSTARSGVAETPGSAPAQADVDRVTEVLGAGGLTVVDAEAGLHPTRCDHAVIVTPTEVRAAAAAAHLAAEYRAANIPASVVMRHRVWSGMDADEMAHVTKTEVIAEVRNTPKLVRATELTGLPQRLPKSLSAAAEKILEVAA